MDLLSITLIALVLSFDTFAVSVSSGLKNTKLKFFEALKIAFFLAFFQAAMPALGWFAGSSLKNTFAEFDHWIAFSLLFLIGLKMIFDGFSKKENKKDINPLHFPTLLLLSIATSIDALVVGFSFAFLQVNIFFSVIIIGTITGIVAMMGMLFGKNVSGKLGNKAEIAGGLILIGIGLKILLTHIL